jgi:type II secretory pathway pseudopilin PulG
VLRPTARRRSKPSGFSLLEILFTTLILLVGLVAVAQLMPASLLLNQQNRSDSSMMVLAQGELDQMLDQPLTALAFTDAAGHPCSLGNPALPNQKVGSPFDNNGLIDFAQATVPGYNVLLQPDPSGPQYDLRWAVITISSGSTAYSKRFILRTRQVGGTAYIPPVTLDAMVSK